jgi:transmembrane sensor
VKSGQSSAVELANRPLAEAIEWRVRLAELETETCLEFDAWVSYPDNRAAWHRVNSVWNLFGEYSSESCLLGARHTALGDAKRRRLEYLRPHRLGWLVGIAAALVLFCGASWGGWYWSERPVDYQTASGERRVVVLADGSTLSLDSGTDVTVRYTAHSRELRLIKGQARFDVAHDVARPFSVLAKDQKVIATGTAFNINLMDQKVLVTLIEGHVVVENVSAKDQVRPGRAVLASVELKAGQQLEQQNEQPPQIKTANIEQATAWMDGKAEIDNDTLESLVAQANHYSRTPIVIDDPDVAAMRVSGVFNVANQTAFLDVVTQYLPVRAVSTCTGTVRLERRRNN